MQGWRNGFWRGTIPHALPRLFRYRAQRNRLAVFIRGRLRTLVNGFETANDLKAYRVEFSYAGARMHLKSFKEIPNAGN